MEWPTSFFHFISPMYLTIAHITTWQHIFLKQKIFVCIWLLSTPSKHNYLENLICLVHRYTCSISNTSHQHVFTEWIKNKYENRIENCPHFPGPLLFHAVSMGCREEKSNHQRAHMLLRKSTLWKMKCSLSLAFSQASHQGTFASGAVIGPWGACDVDLALLWAGTDGSFAHI